MDLPFWIHTSLDRSLNISKTQEVWSVRQEPQSSAPTPVQYKHMTYTGVEHWCYSGPSLAIWREKVTVTAVIMSISILFNTGSLCLHKIIGKSRASCTHIGCGARWPPPPPLFEAEIFLHWRDSAVSLQLLTKSWICTCICVCTCDDCYRNTTQITCFYEVTESASMFGLCVTIMSLRYISEAQKLQCHSQTSKTAHMTVYVCKRFLFEVL